MFTQRSVSKADRVIRSLLAILFVLSLFAGLPAANVAAERANAPLAAINYNQFATLTATDSGTNAHFGSALAIEKDVAVVGVPDATIGNKNGQGAVYIFYRDQGGIDKWGLVKKLTASDGEGGDHFGNSVAISGETIIVGAKDATLPASSKTFNAGVAYIFQRNYPTTDAWSETQILSASDGQKNDRFGTAVAIHDNVAFAGSPYEDPQGGSNNSGSAYLFVRPSANAPFQQVKKMSANASGTVGDKYGSAMALDGETLVVGAPMMKINGNNGQGMTYVYSYVQDAAGSYQFTNTAQLWINTGTAGNNFGNSVAISNNIIAIGAPSSASPTGGAAYLYKRNNAGQWTQLIKETANPAQAGNLFGTSVALDGDLLAVGAPGDTVNGLASTGQIYLFARDQDTPGSWNQVGPMSVTDGSSAANDRFGTTTGISGATVLGGVPGKTLTLSGQGAVYVMRANFQLEIDLNGPASSIDYYLTYRENSGFANITTPDATITNSGITRLDKMQATITNLRDTGSEFLAATASGAIAQSDIQYDSTSGILTIDPAVDPDGKAPIADFINVLRTVQYSNTSHYPDTLDRIVRFWVSDGATSNMQEPAAYIAIQSLNDAPVISADTAKFLTPLNTALDFNGALSISDLDVFDKTIQASLGVTNGALTLGQTTGLTFSAGDGTADVAMTFTGTLADVNAALLHMVFTPDAQFVGPAELTVSVNDLGNTGDGGPQTTTGAYTITVYNPAANNPPSDISPAAAEVREDAKAGTPVATFTVTDPDPGDATTLAMVSGTGCDQNPPFELQNRTLVTTAALDYETKASYALCMEAKDKLGATLDVVVTISVLNVNEAPVNHLPAAQVVDEDNPLTITGLSVSDVDAGENAILVKLWVNHGTLDLKDKTGLTVTGSGAAINITGGQSAINAAFSKGLIYTPAANYNGADTLTVFTDDQNETGLGGPLTATNTLAITVNPMKDISKVTILSTNPDIPHMDKPFTVNFKVESLAGIPSGTVTVTSSVKGASVNCSGKLNASGLGSCVMTVAKDGNFSFTAQYAGDANFLPSASNPYLYEVLPYQVFFTMTGTGK